jgi:shikimate kinase
MKLIYIIGMPGTGKTTLMKSLMNRIGSDWKAERVIDLLDTEKCGNVRVLGKYDGEGTFAGTDRLSMAVAPKAIEWIKTKPDEIIIGEGDRLNSKQFFEAAGDDLEIIHLTVADTTREQRYKARGSEQSDKFIQTTRSKCKNVLDAFGPRATLFGEERGCVTEFTHENADDTKQVVDYIMESIS